MQPEPETEFRYNIARFVEVLEASKHIAAGEPGRSIHHFLRAYLPELAFVAYSLSGGKAESVRDMLLESRQIVTKNDGVDWITPLYGKDYNL